MEVALIASLASKEVWGIIGVAMVRVRVFQCFPKWFGCLRLCQYLNEEVFGFDEVCSRQVVVFLFLFFLIWWCGEVVVVVSAGVGWLTCCWWLGHRPLPYHGGLV